MDNDSCSVFGDVNVIEKDASRQYLYCLSLQQNSISTSKVKGDSISVGILDIVWRSNLGERGHLQTSTLQTMVNLKSYDTTLYANSLSNVRFFFSILIEVISDSHW